jgi:multimeric flavodoxin WrbA
VKILAIGGSPRIEGNTDYLVDEALAEAASLGAETEKIVLSQHKVLPCLGHDDCASRNPCAIADDASWILDRMCEADAVILATPVYYYNISAQLKALMDRNYYLYMHDRKAKARALGLIVIAEASGIEDTVHTLKRFINESFTVPKEQVFVMSGIAGRMGDAQANTKLSQAARKLGKDLVTSLK